MESPTNLDQCKIRAVPGWKCVCTVSTVAIIALFLGGISFQFDIDIVPLHSRHAMNALLG